MLKSLALLVLLTGGAAAADSISEQNQIYIVSGVLGGVCLLLTIAAIFTTLSIIKLQTQVAVLQAGAKTIMEPPPSNTLPGSGGAFVSDSRLQEPQQQPQTSPQRGLPRTDVPNRFGSPPREDPYRAPARERENIRMQGFNPLNYYDSRYEMNGPAPPPRPYRGPPARDSYY